MEPGPDKSRTPGLSPLERLVAARQAEKQAQRKRDTRVLAVVAAAVLLLAGGGAFAVVRLAPRSWLHHSAHAAPSVRVTPTPQNLSTSGPALTGAPAGPFFGSPAQSWADGAAGISVPAGRAHGPYTAAQVRSALETTRRLLIAGNLDWPTLRGGTLAAFAGLLTSQERQEFMAGLHTTALNHDGSERNTRTWVSSFAPGTRFVTIVIKVHGTMSASTATDSGSEVLRIKVNFLFVYAVEPAGHPADWMRIVQHRYGYVDFARWDDPGGALEPWYSVGGQTGGALCGVRDGYIHPDFPHGPPPSVQASGAPVDPYSLATPSALSGYGCQATTGT
ncbi:MAG TPA: hypothetical protein VKU77_24585 [Streptosporangiaceae bacterium]|nr:hypothetical protein [Streptosporangiaceae bacterium]